MRPTRLVFVASQIHKFKWLIEFRHRWKCDRASLPSAKDAARRSSQWRPSHAMPSSVDVRDRPIHGAGTDKELTLKANPSP